MSDLRPPTPQGEYGILLPCAPDSFAEFISGLLGKPQRIERHYEGDFNFTRDEVENVYHLLEQRVHQQNIASLVQFSIAIEYKDGSSVTLNSLSDFQMFNEVRPLVSVGATLSWIYLIQFRDKQAPEKQKIDLTVSGPESRITFAIEHTARTWGADIEALLSNYVSTLIIPEPSWQQAIYKHSDHLGIVTFGILLVLILLASYLGTHRFAQIQMAEAKATLAAGQMAKEVNFLIERFARGEWAQFYFALYVIVSVSIGVAALMGFWVASASERIPVASVTFTKPAKDFREKQLQNRQRRLLSFIGSLVLSLCTGVAANLIFMYLLPLLRRR